MERKKILVSEVRETTMGDIPAFRRVQGEAWLVTYPSPENGVFTEWVKEQVSSRFTNEGLERSKEFIANVLADPLQMHNVAIVGDEVVGFVHVSTREDGTKELEAIYVSPKVFGRGVGANLMAAADRWIDGVKTWVTVATYNKRAIRFYEKHGFRLLPGSEGFYRDIIPTIKMGRDAEYISEEVK